MSSPISVCLSLSQRASVCMSSSQSLSRSLCLRRLFLTGSGLCVWWRDGAMSHLPRGRVGRVDFLQAGNDWSGFSLDFLR